MEIVEMIVALVVMFCLGMIFSRVLANRRRADGAVEISDSDARTIFQFEINIEPEELATKERIIFDVVKIKETKSGSQESHRL